MIGLFQEKDVISYINTNNILIFKLNCLSYQLIINHYGLKGSMIGICIIGRLSLLGLLCHFNRIRMAIAIIKTAALFIIEIPFIMLVPPVFTFLVTGYWRLWIMSFIYIYSMEISRKVVKHHWLRLNGTITFIIIWFIIYFMGLCSNYIL